ncbi:MAG: DUF167 domain-containing protein [Polyangiales bacterium]
MEVANAIREIEGGVSILVRAQPRASRSAVVGVIEARGGAALKIAVAAPPVEGAANAAIVDLLADKLGVPKRSVVIARGETGREKQVHVVGITMAQAVLRLGA